VWRIRPISYFSAQGKHWHFTVLRPEAICSFALGNPMNLTIVIAAYAAISRELGSPVRFPGTEKAYRALYRVTSADILARATAWAGETAAARNQIFNITNGDGFRWQHMWLRISLVVDLLRQAAESFPLQLDLRRHVEHVDGHGGDARLRDRMKSIACRRLIGNTSRRPRRTSIKLRSTHINKHAHAP
jgi:nucleoside-diphosphate-sugar epimerase